MLEDPGPRGGCNHTDPNKMSLSASFPGAASTKSVVLANCSAALLSLDKVVRLLLTASVIRTGGKKLFSFFPFYTSLVTSIFKKYIIQFMEGKNGFLFCPLLLKTGEGGGAGEGGGKGRAV